MVRERRKGVCVAAVDKQLQVVADVEPPVLDLDLDLDSFIKRAKRASSEWRSGRYLHLELPKPCELRGRI